MTTRKRQQLPRPKESPVEPASLPAGTEAGATSAGAEAGATAERDEPVAAQSQVPADAARLWVLPTAKNEFWAVAEETDRAKFADELRAKSPALLGPPLNAVQKNKAVKSSRETIGLNLRICYHEAMFNLLKRLLIGAAWVLVALVSLRLPGELRVIDSILLVMGLGYLGYSFFRYGSALARWHGRRVDAERAFDNVVAVRSPLVERLAKAMKLRAKLNQDERGQSPDEELLDTSSYRKLIKEGIVTRDEFVALGKAISRELGLDAPQAQDRKISELAADARLDIDTTIFYRDLANAAREIELTPDELQS